MTEELIIPAGASRERYWRELWSFRELFWFLAWRDLLVRYKQTAAGLIWAVLRPALSIGVLTFVFGRIANLPSGGAPYAIFVLAGLLPWQFFASGLTESGASLLNNANLVSKIYFPRMILPASAILTALVDFAISLLILGMLMAWHQFVPSWRMLFLPVAALLGIMTAAGAGLWSSALVVKYRDVRLLLPFVAQIGFFVTPVAYSSDLVRAEWQWVYSLNPLAGVVDAFRWSILGGTERLITTGFLVSCASGMALFASGLRYFRRTEREFADVI